MIYRYFLFLTYFELLKSQSLQKEKYQGREHEKEGTGLKKMSQGESWGAVEDGEDGLSRV